MYEWPPVYNKWKKQSIRKKKHWNIHISAHLCKNKYRKDLSETNEWDHPPTGARTGEDRTEEAEVGLHFSEYIFQCRSHFLNHVNVPFTQKIKNKINEDGGCDSKMKCQQKKKNLTGLELLQREGNFCPFWSASLPHLLMRGGFGRNNHEGTVQPPPLSGNVPCHTQALAGRSGCDQTSTLILRGRIPKPHVGHTPKP